MTVLNWLWLFRRYRARRDTAPACPKIYRPRPPAPFCTHIATTMQWRISGEG